MKNLLCPVCTEQNCNEQRCKDLLVAIEEIKIEAHTLEQLINDIYP